MERKTKGGCRNLREEAVQDFPSTPPAPPTEPPGQESSPGGQGSRRRLNPAFVDWLQGFPIGHSDCDSTVTPAARNRWRRLSSLCLRHWLKGVTK